ncbi:hypothetical protein EDB89DRAFT_2066274 [Lactarius sanguifluus]|nr:hypothetical protein EDB89DRAFT_2066274 [Lactarius sanguifluus]
MATWPLMIYLLIFLLFPFRYGRAQQTLFPAATPLAVRSPYLNCWNHANTTWPGTFEPYQIRPWYFLLRVDGSTYSFMSDGLPSPGEKGGVNVTDTIITPTQTVIAAWAGPMQVNFTFLNPIEPGDWVKQSIPFSYLALSAKSLDGVAHSVQVYSDVKKDWTSGDRAPGIPLIVFWNTTSINSVIYHTIRLQNPIGSFYYAMKSASNVTFSVAQYITPRDLFMRNGSLDNQTETNFTDSDVVFAISRDLGNIQATQDPVVWTIGLTTDPVINYTDLSGLAPRQRSLFYKTRYSDDTSLIVDFLDDFANAYSRAQKLDQKILQAAAPVSDLLGDLVSLATAQVYGSTHLTVGIEANGTYNESDVMMFMKNIGGLETNRVNAVETLYSAFPAFMYIDATLGRPLLEPLFQLQASPNYTIPYAAADLGSSYPNVTIINSNHSQGVEQSGNMLIMTYAHVRATGDGIDEIRQYSLLTSWANYLSNSTLVIHDRTSGLTNLGIKGIIAIEAMSKMSSVVKQTADADKYSNTAARLYSRWKSLALASDQHLVATYGEAVLWTLGYNLFADAWLDTGVVESPVFEGQSSFIDSISGFSNFKFGLPVDSLSGDVTVAISSRIFIFEIIRATTYAQILFPVHNRASFNASAGAFPLYYDSANGSTVLGSPAQGAMYAPLALTAPVVQIVVNATTTTSSKSTSHIGAVAGGTAGGVAALFVVIGTIALVRRRQRQTFFRKSAGPAFSGVAMVAHPQITVTPFNLAPVEAAPLPPSQSAAPVPVGLTSKALARLRSLRSAAVRSPLTRSRSSAGGSQHTDPPTISHSSTTEGSTVTLPQTRRLQMEMETLRREMQELRAERFEAPPSYGAGDGV